MSDAKVRFDCFDPLMLDQQLTETERMVRDAARAYCRKNWLPGFRKPFGRSVPTGRSSPRWASWGCWERPYPKPTAAPA